MKKQFEIVLNQNDGEYYGKLFIEAKKITKISERSIDVDGLVIQYSELIISINVLESPTASKEYPALSELFYLLQRYGYDVDNVDTNKMYRNDKVYLEIDLLYMQIYSEKDYYEIVKELEKYADVSLTEEFDYVHYPDGMKKERFYIPLNK